MRKCSRLQLSFEYKTTHGNTQHYSQKAAVDQHGTPSITDEGQWNAYHWHESDHHTDIYYNLPEKIKEDSGTEGASKTLSGITHRIINGIEKKAEKCNKRHTPHKSPFLAENSHGKVGVLFGQKAQLALCTGLKTLAEHFT